MPPMKAFYAGQIWSDMVIEHEHPVSFSSLFPLIYRIVFFNCMDRGMKAVYKPRIFLFDPGNDLFLR